MIYLTETIILHSGDKNIAKFGKSSLAKFFPICRRRKGKLFCKKT